MFSCCWFSFLRFLPFTCEYLSSISFFEIGRVNQCLWKTSFFLLQFHKQEYSIRRKSSNYRHQFFLLCWKVFPPTQGQITQGTLVKVLFLGFAFAPQNLSMEFILIHSITLEICHHIALQHFSLVHVSSNSKIHINWFFLAKLLHIIAVILRITGATIK